MKINFLKRLNSHFIALYSISFSVHVFLAIWIYLRADSSVKYPNSFVSLFSHGFWLKLCSKKAHCPLCPTVWEKNDKSLNMIRINLLWTAVVTQWSMMPYGNILGSCPGAPLCMLDACVHTPNPHDPGQLIRGGGSWHEDAVEGGYLSHSLSFYRVKEINKLKAKVVFPKVKSIIYSKYTGYWLLLSFLNLFATTSD